MSALDAILCTLLVITISAIVALARALQLSHEWLDRARKATIAAEGKNKVFGDEVLKKLVDVEKAVKATREYIKPTPPKQQQQQKRQEPEEP